MYFTHLIVSLSPRNQYLTKHIIMRTKLLSFFAIFFMAGSLRADDISVEQALGIAERFFAGQHASAKVNARSGAKASAMNVAYTSYRQGDKVALYVINRGSNDGFVLVSAESDTDYPVLGWSDNGSFDYDKAPIQLRDMLEAYSHSSQKQKSQTDFSADGLITLSDGSLAIQETDGKQYSLRALVPTTARRAAPQHRVETVPNIVVQPLVKVQWDQVGEYAKYVDPYFTYVGCVPTAMAQIMAFWKYPAQGRGTHLHNILDTPDNIDFNQLILSGQYDEVDRIIEEYSHPYIVNFGESVYKWDEMGGSHPVTDTQIDNVAKVLFDCHVSCAPEKLPDDRGTASTLGNAADAMVRYFGYSPEMQYIQCKGKEDLMRQELDEGRPILMAGTPREGSIIKDSHAIVCDGYAENGYFHLNFGWSGSGDGFYLLENVNPVGSDFSLDQHAYIGIRPSLAFFEEGNAFINVMPDSVGVVVGGYGDVNMPATVTSDGKTYPVMKVGEFAFTAPSSPFSESFEQYRQEFPTRITLPESVTEIGANAFMSPYLTEVNLPSNIRKIGANAFVYNSKTVNIPSIEAWLNIDFEPYEGWQYKSNPLWSTDYSGTTRLYIAGEELKDLVVPGTVKEVKAQAFTGYQFLNSVTLEEGVEKVGASAFERVPLKEINIATTVKELGYRAFYDHKASVISIPANLNRVGTEALIGDKLSEYVVDENNKKYSAYMGILYDKSRRTLVHCPNLRPGFQYDKWRDAVGVPSSVTTIRAHAFGDKLTKLTLPPSVRNIEDEAFAYTYNLRDLYVYSQEPLPVTTSMFHLNAFRMNVHVPVGAGDAYRAAPVWQDMNIVEDEMMGSNPLEHYDYPTDFNAIQITDYMPADGVSYMPQFYLFDSQPVITYQGTSMLITSKTSSYLFEKDHYQEMYFVHYDDPDGINEVETRQNGVVIRTEGNRLIIRGLEANVQVMLYSVEGRQLASAKASANGEVSMKIPIADIIVVKAGNCSFKIHTKNRMV